eukprot:TRINITY_DN26837_c0_g1_i1.p1 TRINITY_DN26837_c0_g1~~TRINITY_DN26837_c0_g1_i1.p1  ORF type:complete len:411 (-),score=70.69 TRINITY_DN26837_c0_g1_i1:118-1350(-)
MSGFLLFANPTSRVFSRTPIVLVAALSVSRLHCERFDDTIPPRSSRRQHNNVLPGLKGDDLRFVLGELANIANHGYKQQPKVKKTDRDNEAAFAQSPDVFDTSFGGVRNMKASLDAFDFRSCYEQFSVDSFLAIVEKVQHSKTDEQVQLRTRAKAMLKSLGMKTSSAERLIKLLGKKKLFGRAAKVIDIAIKTCSCSGEVSVRTLLNMDLKDSDSAELFEEGVDAVLQLALAEQPSAKSTNKISFAKEVKDASPDVHVEPTDASDHARRLARLQVSEQTDEQQPSDGASPQPLNDMGNVPSGRQGVAGALAVSSNGTKDSTDDQHKTRGPTLEQLHVMTRALATAGTRPFQDVLESLSTLDHTTHSSLESLGDGKPHNSKRASRPSASEKKLMVFPVVVCGVGTLMYEDA